MCSVLSCNDDKIVQVQTKRGHHSCGYNTNHYIRVLLFSQAESSHACLTHALHFYSVPYNVILEIKPTNVFSKQNLAPSCFVLSMVNTASELEINVDDKHRKVKGK